jgi:ribosomal protein L40E
MNAEFTAIIQRLITEQGREILFSVQRCKAFLADYTHGEYKKESRLLLLTVEAGATKELESAQDLAICKQKLVRDLQDDFFITEDIAVNVINMLAFVLRGDTSKPAVSKAAAGKNKPAPDQAVFSKSNPIRPLLEDDIVRHSLGIWICGRCNTTNDFAIDSCKKCGKEFNPPLVRYKGKEIKISRALWE